MSARSSEGELGIDVVGESSPLFGSAIGTFVFISAILNTSGYVQSKRKVCSSNERSGCVPESDRAATAQLSKELLAFERTRKNDGVQRQWTGNRDVKHARPETKWTVSQRLNGNAGWSR